MIKVKLLENLGFNGSGKITLIKQAKKQLDYSRKYHPAGIILKIVLHINVDKHKINYRNIFHFLQIYIYRPNSLSIDIYHTQLDKENIFYQ
jgi:ABC-type phosphate transport system ATPase subunit